MVIDNGQYCVYCHTNKINGKKYIGQTKSDPLRRWGSNGCNYRNQVKFYRVIQKYGWDNFDHEIIASNLTKDEADNFEIILINHLDTVNNGYNVAIGGGGCSGWHLSKEQKDHLSQVVSGENHPNYGKHFKPETIEKMRQAKLGKKNLKITGANNYISKQVEYDGIVFDTIQDCANYIGVSSGRLSHWLNYKALPSKNVIDNHLRFVGGEYLTVYQNTYNQVICDGIIFKNAKKCASYYNVCYGSLQHWLKGERKMPQEWKDRGLAYYKGGDVYAVGD